MSTADNKKELKKQGKKRSNVKDKQTAISSTKAKGWNHARVESAFPSPEETKSRVKPPLLAAEKPKDKKMKAGDQPKTSRPKVVQHQTSTMRPIYQSSVPTPSKVRATIPDELADLMDERYGTKWGVLPPTSPARANPAQATSSARMEFSSLMWSAPGLLSSPARASTEELELFYLQYPELRPRWEVYSPLAVASAATGSESVSLKKVVEEKQQQENEAKEKCVEDDDEVIEFKGRRNMRK